MAWTKSDAFVQGHRQGSLMGVLEGPPMVKLYESVIEQRRPSASAYSRQTVRSALGVTTPSTVR
jgi:hypothetical protein